MFTSKVLNPNVYTIELSHWDFTWKIKRCFKHFQALHQELLMFKAPLKLPLPTCIFLSAREEDESFVLKLLSLSFPSAVLDNCKKCEKWLVVKDSFVLSMRPKNNQVGMVNLCDRGFHIKMSTLETGVHYGVTILNLCRQEALFLSHLHSAVMA
ncbi:phospholipase D1 [Notolabrus celidotus]|uniref:phospholipase D1 n=1 Tax=Notolabrus celidotus TaxID=1203425 RepID=UPI00148F8C63|nr:phospholipase D1 [Notolabrus celidotus]